MPIDAPGNRIATESEPPPRGRVRGTLAGRIALVTTAVAVITALIVAAVSVPQIRAAAASEAQQSLARSADSVAASLDNAVTTVRLPSLTLMRLRSGQVDLQRTEAGQPLPAYLSQADAEDLRSTGDLSTTAQIDGSSHFVEGRVLGDGSLLFFTEAASVAAPGSTRDLTRLFVALAIGVIIAAVAGLILARRLARPLRVAAAAAEQMARGQRDVALIPEGPMEVAEVAESLNDLNAALSTSEARQREFLLSVSHELRTPLTSIQGYSEALADGVVPPEDVPATAALLTAEASRLDRLVADLLDLARMGAREVRIDAVQVDLAPMLAETVQVWSDRCQAEDVVFRSEVDPGELVLQTDPVRVRQIVDNLLANALRMTPPGEPIVLAASMDDDEVVIEVRDGGPGLTDDDLAVAFEPAELYSRYRGVRKVGSGVGLALVGRLAERMGGTAHATDAPEGGAAFVIRLPRFAAAALPGA